MEKVGGGDAAPAGKRSVVLPFVQGGLTGFLRSTCSLLRLSLEYKLNYHDFSSSQRTNYHSYFKRFPVTLFIESTFRALQFGSFEILKQRLEAANHERPLSLYQEASCGMAAGAIGTIFYCPISLACSRIEANANLMSLQQSYIRNLLLDLCHTVMDKGILALYKGGVPYTAWAIGFYTGMFASYGRSVSYFRDSFGLGKPESQLASSAVSGFAASVCSLPCLNLAHAINAVQKNEKLQCKSFLDCTLKSFQIHGKMILYKGFTAHTSRNVIPVMATWCAYEVVRDVFPKLP